MTQPKGKGRPRGSAAKTPETIARLLVPAPNPADAGNTGSENFRAPATIHEAISSMAEDQGIYRGEVISLLLLEHLWLTEEGVDDAELLRRVQNIRAATDPKTHAILQWVRSWRNVRRRLPADLSEA